MGGPANTPSASSRAAGPGQLQSLLRRSRRGRERDMAVLQHYAAAGTLDTNATSGARKLSATSSDVRLRPHVRLQLLPPAGSSSVIDASEGFQLPGATLTEPHEGTPDSGMHPALASLLSQSRSVSLAQHLVLSVAEIQHVAGCEEEGGTAAAPGAVGDHVLLVSRADVTAAGCVGFSALKATAAAGGSVVVYFPWTAMQLPYSGPAHQCGVPALCTSGLLALCK